MRNSSVSNELSSAAQAYQPAVTAIHLDKHGSRSLKRNLVESSDHKIHAGFSVLEAFSFASCTKTCVTCLPNAEFK